jgi:hypothetical protein
MAACSDSYVLKVLFAPETPARGLAAVARQWRKILDPYRPEAYYMRGPGPKWREKHAQIANASHDCFTQSSTPHGVIALNHPRMQGDGYEDRASVAP